MSASIHTSLPNTIARCQIQRSKLLSIYHNDVLITTSPSKSTKQLCNAIRPATIQDIQSIVSIEETCCNWNHNQVIEELHRDRAVVLVHQHDDNNNVNGWIVAWHVPPDELQILEIAVHPDHRRKGIATLLLQSLIHNATTMNTTTTTSVVLLEVRASNHAAIQLYEKEGFEVVGKRPRFYSDGEDALLMNKYL